MKWIFWPFAKKNFGSAWTTYSNFRGFIDPTMGRYIIQDEARLPHPKAEILEALYILLTTETNADLLESARACAFELAFFHKAVGDRPLYPLGIDTAAFEDGSSDWEPTSKLALADPSAKEKYDRFKRLRDVEWTRIQSAITRLQATSTEARASSR